jgi:hypothetical protein
MARWNMLSAHTVGQHTPVGTRVTLHNLSHGSALGNLVEVSGSRVCVKVDGQAEPMWAEAGCVSVLHNTQAVVFLATHLSSRRRVRSLRHCLQSISKQSTTAELHISWSATPDIEAEVEEMLEAGRFTSPELCHHQPKRLSQFRHYLFLTRRLEAVEERVRTTHGEPVTWVLFSDDDDVWHPSRLEFYCLQLQQSMSEEQRHEEQAITCQWYAMPAANGLPPATTAEEVTSWLHGRPARWRINLIPPGSPAEHWCSLIRLDRLIDFFDVAPEALLSSTYCDTAFVHFIDRGASVFANQFKRTRPRSDAPACKVPFGSDGGTRPWLYAHNASARVDATTGSVLPFDADRRGEGEVLRAGGSHAGVDEPRTQADDVAAALRTLPLLTQRFPSCEMTAEVLARMLAIERSNLDYIVAGHVWIVGAAGEGQPANGIARARARAVKLVTLVFEDLERIWRNGGLASKAEVATQEVILALTAPETLRTLLIDYAIKDADAIADLFGAECKLRGDAAGALLDRLACGGVSTPAAAAPAAPPYGAQETGLHVAQTTAVASEDRESSAPKALAAVFSDFSGRSGDGGTDVSTWRLRRRRGGGMATAATLLRAPVTSWTPRPVAAAVPRVCTGPV